MLLALILALLSALATGGCLLLFYCLVVCNPETPDDVPEWPAIGISVGTFLTIGFSAAAVIGYLVRS